VARRHRPYAQTAIVEENIPKVGSSGQAVIFSPSKNIAVLAPPVRFTQGEQAMHTGSLLLLLCLAACSGQGAVTYAGPLQPLAGQCDTPARSELVLRGSAVLFAPASATLLLRGHRKGAALDATQRLTGADHKPYALVFHGTLQDDAIRGVYQTPRCRYAVALARTQD
jgi:hypothetical protein